MSKGQDELVRIMLRLVPHSTTVTYFLKEHVYPIRRLVARLAEFDVVLYGGKAEQLKQICNETKVLRDKKPDMEHVSARNFPGPDVELEKMNEKFKDLVELYEKKLKDHPMETCYFCERNVSASQLARRVKDMSVLRSEKVKANLRKMLVLLWEDVEESEVDECIRQMSEPIDICKHCMVGVSKGQIAAAMTMNALEVEDIPDELKDLNYFEKLLVERTRAFYSIVRLQTCSKFMNRNAKKLVEGVKGNVVNMWMPAGETSSYVLQTMPAKSIEDRLRVFARSKPNKADVIYENLVDMKKVLRALCYLKTQNPCYRNVIIDASQSEVNWKQLIEIQYEKDNVTGKDSTVMEEKVEENADEDGDTFDENDYAEMVALGMDYHEIQMMLEEKAMLKMKDEMDEEIARKLVEHYENDPLFLEADYAVKEMEALQLLAEEDVEMVCEEDVEMVCEEEDNVKEPPEMKSMLMDLWEPEAYEQYVMQSTEDAKVCAGEHLKAYQQAEMDAHFLNYSDTEDLDVMGLTYLFPSGIGGIDDKRRGRKIRPREYCQYRIAHSSGRFRKSTRWMQMMYFMKRDRAMNQGLYASLKTGSKLAHMTAGQFKKGLNASDVDMERDLNMGFATIKGTQEYWSRQCGDLKAMDEQLGAATFFVTLSCAEFAWPELEKYLRTVNRDMKNVGEMTVDDLIGIDPASVSEFFMRKFKSFMDHMILAKDEKGRRKEGALGFVEHYYWRLEYQARGAPHIHMKLWIKDAPILGKDSQDSVLEFIAKYIRADVPNETENYKLHQLVRKYQMHKCTKSCREYKSSKYGQYSRCRYGYPIAESEVYAILGVKESVESKHKANRKVKKSYVLPRSSNDTNVNPYNPAILMNWEANMDIQYIRDEGNVLNAYITGYLTKSEKKSTEGLWEAVAKDEKAPSGLMSILKQRFRDREVGMYEIADDLLGHSLHGSSDSVVYCGAGLPEKRGRKAKTKIEIMNMKDNCTDLLVPNMIEYYYPLRGEDVEEVSLFDFVRYWKYEKIKGGKKTVRKEESEDDEDETMGGSDIVKSKDEKFQWLKRKKPVIVKTRNVGLTEKTCEEYYQLLLQLHVPYRSEDELKKGQDTFKESFELITMGSSEVAQRLKEAHEKKEQSRKHTEMRKEWEEEAAAEEEDENETEGHNADVDQCFESVMPMSGNVNGESDYATESGLAKCVDSLNLKQRKVYDIIMKRVRHQVEHKDGKCDCVESGKQGQILKFVSGGAGVGKSKLIETLTEGLETLAASVKERKVKNPVVLSAPTGMAARNIGGGTLHAIFRLPRQTKNNWQYKRARTEEEKMVYETINGTLMVIIDEISMVSNRCLAFVHLRCCDVLGKAYTEPFGGLNVLVLGDLLQLPPVGLKTDKTPPYCFVKMTEAVMSKAFPESASRQFPIFLWPKFEYMELTENMRQKEDMTYADMLNRIRIGQLVKNDLVKLENRMKKSSETTAELLVRLKKEGNRPMCLMPLREQVRNVNVEALLLDGIEPVMLHATDVRYGGRKYGKKKGKGWKGTDDISSVREYLNKMNGKDAQETGGLENVVMLGVNAPVMLTRNVDVSAGLFNGATGIVKRFVRNKESPDGISAVEVELDGDQSKKTCRIERLTVTYVMGKAVSVERSQFPLVLSYAITVHKSQGLSLNCVVADVGNKVFAYGMTYVVLSRVRKLDGLHLLEFDPDFVMADPIAVQEYNRLRAMYEKDLEQLELPKKTKFGYLLKKKINVFDADMMKNMESETAHSKMSLRTTERNDRTPVKRRKVIEVDIDDEDVAGGRRRPRDAQVQTATPAKQRKKRAPSVGRAMFWQECELEAWDEIQSLTRESQHYLIPLVDPDVKITAPDRCKEMGKVKYCGREMLAYDVRGDGNCTFRALSCAITGDERQYTKYRSDMAEWLNDNWKSLDASSEMALELVHAAASIAVTETRIARPHDTRYRDYEQRLDEISEDAVAVLCEIFASDTDFTGSEVLSIASVMLDIAIVVVDSDRQHIGRIWKDKDGERPKAEIWLRFTGNNHYQVLRPTKRSKKLSML